MFVAWHIKGAAGTSEEWAKKTDFDRSVIVKGIARRIEIHNAPFDDF